MSYGILSLRSLLVFSLVIFASLPTFAQSRPPGYYCAAFFETEPALLAEYDAFSAYPKAAYATYVKLSSSQREAIREFEIDLITESPSAPVESIRRKLSEFKGLGETERREVFTLLGLGEANVGDALEVYRKKLQYLFWSDHSSQHMWEILDRSRTLSNTAPPSFLNYFSPTLFDSKWSERIDRAIRLHDSRMSFSRAQHAELLLDWKDGNFPEHWTDFEKATASLLAMLHSKSTVSYAKLPKWKEIVTQEIIPKLLEVGQITPVRVAAIQKALPFISTDDMARAAAWLRVVDSVRPIGSELRNSIGQSIHLSADGREVLLRTPIGEVPAMRSQFSVNYGQLAIGDLALKTMKDGVLLIHFPIRLRGEIRTKVVAELSRLDIRGALLKGNLKEAIRTANLGRESSAIAEMVGSIVGDFPPDLLATMRLEIK